MAKTATVHARMEPEIKRRAEQIIKETGLSVSTAQEIFYRQIIAHQGLPFELRIPRKETLQAMQEARSGIGEKYDTVQELFEDC